MINDAGHEINVSYQPTKNDYMNTLFTLAQKNDRLEVGLFWREKIAHRTKLTSTAAIESKLGIHRPQAVERPQEALSPEKTTTEKEPTPDPSHGLTPQ